MPEEKRQWVAILFADISGYTALMQEDEAGTGRLLSRFQEVLTSQTAKYGGKIINFYGDGCLIIFKNPVDAVHCAGSLQIIFQQAPVVPVRVGLHAGDVIFNGENIYGDSVNLTSRIESIGIPGSVLFSVSIKSALENHPEYTVTPLGKFNFKNIRTPTAVYALANKGFAVPRRKNIQGKLDPARKNTSRRIRKKVSSVLSVIGALSLLLALNFRPIKTFLLSAMDDTSIKEKKVAVMTFDNETGDEQLGSIGRMASDWITQQLMNIEGTQVVLPSNVQNNLHLAKAVASLEGIRTFAKATGAEIIIKGRYYRSAGNLIFQAQVVNAQNGEIVHALNQPVIGKSSDPLVLIQEVSQWITGFWAVQDRTYFIDRPPKLEAYQEYVEGRKFWGVDFNQVNYHYQKAFQLDSFFVEPIVELAASKIEQSDYTSADSLLRFAIKRSNHLSHIYQLKARAYLAHLEGNLTKSVNFWEKIYAIDTKEIISVTNLSRAYLNINQPQKALSILEDFDPSFFDFNECQPCQEYYELLSYAHFQLGAFEEVIKLVEGFDFVIKEGLIANYYLKSLVHTGDFDKAYDQLGNYLGEDLTFNGGRQSSGLLLVGLLFELQKQEQQEIAQIVANLLINYGENNYDDWLSDYFLGIGLYTKKKYEDAAKHFEAFYQRFRFVPMIIDLGLGSLACTYIQLGEKEKLDGVYQELNAVNNKYASSYVSYTKAKIEAQLGHPEKAISLLEESIDNGQTFIWFKFQNDPFLLPLFEDPAFIQLIQ